MKYCLLLVGLLGLSISGMSQVASVQDGPWNNTSTWDCGCIPNSSQGVITLGHRVTIPNGFSVTADQIEFDNSVPFGGVTGSLVVETGGTLIVNNGTGDDIRLLNDFSSIATLEVSGTLRLTGGATMVEDDYGNLGIGPGPITTTTYSVLNGGVHQHMTGTGTSAVPSADWQVGSTCRIIAGPGTVPSIDPAIVFYNFIWDGTNTIGAGQSTTMNLAGNLQTVDGDFTILSTNGQLLQLATTAPSAGYTLSVGGNFAIQGNSRVNLTSTAPLTLNVGTDSSPKNFVIASTSTMANSIAFNATTTVTINVSGDFQKSGASVVNLALSSGVTNLNLNGNFSNTAGTITRTAVAQTTSAANVNFNGSGVSTFINTSTISQAINYTVASTKTLDLGTSPLTGTGTLTSNGILRVGSLDAAGAIQLGTAGGNIRVSGARTYGANAAIVYNGTGAQFMASGHPSGINTTISNASGVSLATDVTVADLVLTQGNLTVGAHTLTLGAAVTPNANSIVVAAGSSLVVNGTGDISLPLTGSATISNLTLNRGSGTVNTVYLSNHLTTTGTFTQTNGNLDFRGWILTINGPYVRTAGTLSVNEYTGVLVNGSGAISTLAFSSPPPYTVPTLNTLRLERPSSAVSVSGNLKITTDLLLVSGALTPGSLQMGTGSTLSRYDLGSITATPAAETTYNLIYQTSTDFNTGFELPASATVLANLTNQGPAVVTLDKNATVNGILTLSNGTLNGSTRTLTLKGNFVSNSIGNFVSSPLIFAGTTTISGTTPATFGAITVNSGAILNLGPAVAPATTVNFAGNINNTGTINGGLSTTVFSGSTTLKNGINGKLLGGFNNVQITGTLALQTVTVAPNPDIDIEKITVSGNWIVSGGTFTANFSRVDLTGTSQTLVTNGSAFYSLYLVGAGTVVLNEPLTINNDFVIDTNVTLDVDVNNNYTVTMKDDFTVNGTFQGRLGKVIFTNGESQSILRTSGTGTITLYDLEVNKNSNATVDLQTPVLVQNSLVIKTATVFAAGASFLTLGSDATRTAYVGQLPTGASVTGTVIVQRFMPNSNATRAWRYLASPVTNSFVSDWKAEVPITGTFSDPSTGSGLVTKSPSLYYYDETYVAAGTTLEARYRAYPASGLSTAAPLKNGVGYSIYIRGGTPVIDTRGTIGQGNVSVALTARSATGNDGWNLVGNPYPSTISWDNVTKPASLNNAIYVTDNADNGGTGTGNIISYVAGVGTGGYAGLIAQGQAFFVRATANTTLTFKEADKVAGQAQFFREGEIPNVLRMTMTGQGLMDEAVLRLHDEATDAFDQQYDAMKWPNPSAFNVATLASDNSTLSINALSTLDCNKSIPLTIAGTPNGSYVLSFTGLSSFDANVSMFLYDKTENKTINLRETPQYTVAVTDANKAGLASRFAIVLGKPDADLALVARGEQVCSTSGSAVITLQNSESGVSYALQQGDKVSDYIAGTGKDLQLTVPVGTLTEGENQITILAKSSSCAILPLNEKPVVTVVSTLVSTVEEGKSCHVGVATLKADAPGASGFHWYEDLQSTTAIAGVDGAVFVTPVLNKTRTYYVAALNSLGCEGERVAVKANVVIFDDITLGVEGTTLTASNATNNQWYLDGKLIDGVTGATLTAKASGVYTVQTAVNGCTSSASTEVLMPGEEYTVYPNPTADKITLAIPASKEVRVTLVSPSGINLTTVKLKNTGGQQKGEIDLTAYPDGVYILRVDDGEKLLTKKVTKIK